MRTFIFLMVISCYCLACVPKADTHTNTKATPIIIAFEHKIDDPQSPELIKLLSTQLDCKLDYSHALSNNAYLYKAYTKLNDKELESKLKHLSAHDDIKYAEKDKQRSH